MSHATTTTAPAAAAAAASTASTTKSLKDYIGCARRYIEAAGQLAGKPQNLSVVGDYLYWTQGKQQELYRVPTTDTTAGGVKVIVTEDELEAARRPSIVVSVKDGRLSKSSTPNKHARNQQQQDTPTKAAAAKETPEKKLTKEEEMLRERMRSLVTGISSYHVRESDQAVFYISGLDFYVYYQQGPLAHQPPLKVFDYLSEADKAHFAEKGGKPNLYVQFPAAAGNSGELDFTRVTFVNSNNVYLAELHEDVDNAVAPFALAVTQVTSLGDDEHQCGIADYIVQEEFDRYTGQYAKGKYVVFSYTDMSMMRRVALLKGRGVGNSDDDENDDEGVEWMPYSRVGDPNARCTIVVYNTEAKSLSYIPQTSLARAALASSADFGEVEYIVRFGFKNDDTLYLSLLNRTQEAMAVVSCAIADLPPITEAGLRRLYTTETDNDNDIHVGEVDMMVEWAQQIPWAWVDVMPGAPILFGNDYDLILCAAAETATANYHLYYRPSGQNAAAWQPLTAGNWNVRAGTVRVRKNNTAVSFIANVDGRLRYTLYAVSLPPAAPVESDALLTRHSGVGEHVYGSYCQNETHVYFVASNPHRPAEILCASLEHRQEIRTIPTEPWLKRPGKKNSTSILPAATATATAAEEEEKVEAEEEAFLPSSDQRSFTLFGCPMTAPSLVTVTNRRGVPLSAQLFPAAACGRADHTAVENNKNNKNNNENNKKEEALVARPLVLFVYGGPHVQLVTEHDFDGCCRATVQALSQLGLHVAVVDNQQAACNGLRALSVCKRQMGQFETADYTDVVAALTDPAHARRNEENEKEEDVKKINKINTEKEKEENGWPSGWCVDPSRVAIFGWSYGGYATLLALSQAAAIFKIGIAGAPVGDWRLYDTGYTERYMGLLEKNNKKNKNKNKKNDKKIIKNKEGTEETEKEAAAAALEEDEHEKKIKKIDDPYRSSTIAHFAAGFPDELNRVFLAHGLLDENVHFDHTAQVVDAMVRAGKPFSVLLYPGERHGLRQRQSSRWHHEGTLLKTLVELL